MYNESSNVVICCTSNAIVNVEHLYCTLIYFGLPTISDPKYSYIHATENTLSHCING